MKFEKYLYLINSILNKKGLQLLALKINHPKSRFKLIPHGDFEIVLEYPDNKGYPQEAYFNLDELGARKATNFLSKKYINYAKS